MFRQVRGRPRSPISYVTMWADRGLRPEVPLHVVIAKAGVGEPLLAADEVREIHRVADEEDRRVVATIRSCPRRYRISARAARVAPGVRATASPATVEKRASISVWRPAETTRPWCIG